MKKRPKSLEAATRLTNKLQNVSGAMPEEFASPAYAKEFPLDAGRELGRANVLFYFENASRWRTSLEAGLVNQVEAEHLGGAVNSTGNRPIHDYSFKSQDTSSLLFLYQNWRIS